MKTITELIEILKKVENNPEILDDYNYENLPEIEITCTVWGEEIYPYTRDVGPAEYAEDEYTVNFDYSEDILKEYLMDLMRKSECFDCEDGNLAENIYNIDEGETLEYFVETFVESLTTFFMNEVKDYFYDDAQEQAQDEYDEYRADRAADAEVGRYESSLEDREQDYYERAADYYDNLY